MPFYRFGSDKTEIEYKKKGINRCICNFTKWQISKNGFIYYQQIDYS